MLHNCHGPKKTPRKQYVSVGKKTRRHNDSIRWMRKWNNEKETNYSVWAMASKTPKGTTAELPHTAQLLPPHFSQLLPSNRWVKSIIYWQKQHCQQLFQHSYLDKNYLTMACCKSHYIGKIKKQSCSFLHFSWTVTFWKYPNNESIMYKFPFFKRSSNICGNLCLKLDLCFFFCHDCILLTGNYQTR